MPVRDARTIAIDLRHLRSFVAVAEGVELTELGRALLDKTRLAIEAAEDALAVGNAQQPLGGLVLGVPLAGGRGGAGSI
jgi:hypothetical protein